MLTFLAARISPFSGLFSPFSFVFILWERELVASSNARFCGFAWQSQSACHCYLFVISDQKSTASGAGLELTFCNCLQATNHSTQIQVLSLRGLSLSHTLCLWPRLHQSKAGRLHARLASLPVSLSIQHSLSLCQFPLSHPPHPTSPSPSSRSHLSSPLLVSSLQRSSSFRQHHSRHATPRHATCHIRADSHAVKALLQFA